MYRQFGGVSGGYSEAEYWDDFQRSMALTEQRDAIRIWLRGQNLFASAFGEKVRYSSGAVDPKAFAVRFQLLLLAGRASKPTLDLVLSSYYTEAWALERSMLEGWARSVYLRLKPQEYVRWYEPYSATFGQELPKREPDWGEAKNCILQKGSADDKKWAKDAQLRWDFLNMGAHPSGVGIDQVRGNFSETMKFYPEYEPFYCIQSLGHGVFVQSALLWEIVELSDRPDGFRQDYETFMTDAAALADSVRPALEPLSRAIAAERKERNKRRYAQRRMACSQSNLQD